MSESLRPRFLPDRDAQREWGGKGAALARLIRKRYAVPPTAAMGLTEVQSWLERMPEHPVAISAWRKGDPSASELLSRLHAAILAAPMPAHWNLSGATLRKLLCGDLPEDPDAWPMILRSSMNVEDGAGESLAGCFDSVVVRDTSPAGIWQGFVQVVASAFRESSARRISATGTDPAAFRAGVVIQPYLDAELAGVCFSRDPANPWADDGVVEWVRGAGEALVQGTAEASRKLHSEGSPSELEAFWETLWAKARKAEALVGGPADLEWVWDGRQLWWLQARPIATPEARLAARAPKRRWSRELTLERFPEPMSAMGWSVMGDAFVSNLRTLDRRFGVVARHPSDMAVCVRGTVYSDPGFFSFPGGVSIRWSKHLNPFSRSLWTALGALGAAAWRAVRGRSWPLSRALLRLDIVEALLGAQAADIERGWVSHREGHLARLKAFDPAESGNVLRAMDQLSTLSLEFMEPDLAVYLVKDSLDKALRALWSALGLDEALYVDLFRAFEGNRTLQMNEDWARLVAALRAAPGHEAFLKTLSEHELDGEALQAWRDFLDRNGHSATSWDIAVPTWAESPVALLPLLRASIEAARAPAAPSDGASVKLRRTAHDRFTQALVRELGPRVSRRVLRAVERLEAFMRMDEEHHFLCGTVMAPSRKLVLAGGKLLHQAGLLDAVEDVFHLELGELKSALQSVADSRSLSALALRRRAEWERARRTVAPFELPPASSVLHTDVVPGASEEGSDPWQGRPMSPGTATGRALVADHLDQVQGIEKGMILVTTSPNPALTPLYSLLGGLISTTGSSLSHGFVSAREYSLPAVAGIADATRRIPNGALVRLDGATGRVEVLP